MPLNDHLLTLAEDHAGSSNTQYNRLHDGQEERVCRGCGFAWPVAKRTSLGSNHVKITAAYTFSPQAK